MVDQVRRLLAGLPLYGKPTLEFAPQIYAPLYFHVSALVSRVLGVGFLPLRLVSVAASLGCLVLIHSFVRRETGERGAGLLAAGLFASCYALSGAWLDIARVDSLFLFFALAAIHVLRGDATARGALVSAALFSLAFLTKQQGLLLALPFALYWLVARGRRQAAIFVAGLLVGIGGSTWACEIQSGGWCIFYLFTLPSEHEIFVPMIPGFWIMDLLQPLGLACVVAPYGVLARRTASAGEAGRARDARLFWGILLATCVGVSWGSRVHSGGHVNVVLPAYAALSMAWGVALHRLAAPGVWLWRPVLVWAVCVLQLGWLVRDPRPLLPDAELRRAGDAFVAALGGIEGDLLVPWHGYLPALAGKRVYAHRSVVRDVLRSRQEAVKTELAGELVEAIASHRFAAIVIDNPYFVEPFFAAALQKHYRLEGRLLEEGREFGPVVGRRENPRVYSPRSDVEPEPPRRR